LHHYNKHGAFNGRRQVFNEIFETGKGLKCFANDARIFVKKVEEEYVE